MQAWFALAALPGIERFCAQSLLMKEVGCCVPHQTLLLTFAVYSSDVIIILVSNYTMILSKSDVHRACSKPSTVEKDGRKIEG